MLHRMVRLLLRRVEQVSCAMTSTWPIARGFWRRQAPVQHGECEGVTGSAVGGQKPGLLDEVRRCLRLKHYSSRTEQVYVGWIAAGFEGAAIALRHDARARRHLAEAAGRSVPRALEGRLRRCHARLRS